MKKGIEHFVFQPFLCKKYTGKLISSEKTIPEFINIHKINQLTFITNDIKEISQKGHTLISQNKN